MDENKNVDLKMQSYHSPLERTELENALLCSPGGNLPWYETLRFLAGQCWPSQRRCQAGTLATVAVGIGGAYMGALSPAMYARFTGAVGAAACGDTGGYSQALVFLTLATATEFAAIAAKNLMTALYQESVVNIDRDLVVELVDKFQKSDSPAVAAYPAGHLADIITDYSTSVSKLMELGVTNIIPLIAKMYFTSSQLSAIGDPKLQLAFFGAIALNALIVGMFSYYRMKDETNSIEADSVFLATVSDIVDRRANIEAWNTADYEKYNLESVIANCDTCSIRNNVSLGMMRITGDALYVLGRAFTTFIALGAALSMQGKRDNAIEYVASVWGLFDSTTADVTDGLETWRELLTAWYQLRYVTAIANVPLKEEGELTLKSVNSIHLTDVGFAYPIEGSRNLSDINLAIGEKSMISIIGTSASGKTTLGKLISRHLTPTEGLITVNGSAITEYELRELHRQLLFVDYSEPSLFGSFEESVTYGCHPEISSDELREALVSFGVEDIFSRLIGITTEIGPSGVALSNTETKILLTLRAYFHQNSVVVLDDPLSGTDDTARAILTHIIQAINLKRTVIILSPFSVVSSLGNHHEYHLNESTFIPGTNTVA